MNISFTEDSIAFDDLDGMVAALLRQLPEAASPGDDKARTRLFPRLTANDEKANAEWAEFIEPELGALFQSNVDIVAADLEGMQRDEGSYSFTVPVAHAPAWIHTLNQARLAIGARHDVTEEDMESAFTDDDPSRGMALLQMEVYGIILMAFLEGTEF